MSKHRKTKTNKMLRKNYVIYLELGLVTTLIIFLIAFKVDYRPAQNDEQLTEKQETVKMEDIVQTKQEKEPPPPPRPQVPMEVPNDEVVEEGTIDITADLDMNQKLDIPEPPSNDDGKEDDDEQIFVIVEQQPELVGGLAALQQKIQYPEMARKAGIEGRVYVQFIVNKQGEVEDPKVVRGIGGGCDKEAIRVIKQAKFKPGMQRGRPVKVRYSMPIVFKLTQVQS